MAGHWSHLNSTTIIKTYGVTLCNQISMISEYIKLGSLDVYLKKHKTVLKDVDLIQAASNLASALWYLVSNNVKNAFFFSVYNEITFIIRKKMVLCMETFVVENCLLIIMIQIHLL